MGRDAEYFINPTLIQDAVTYSMRETIEKKKDLEERIGRKQNELELEVTKRKNIVKNYLESDFIDKGDYKMTLQKKR